MNNKSLLFWKLLHWAILLSCVFVLSAPANCQQQKNTGIEMITDTQILENLASQDRELADTAVEEILKRGERMIPLLIQKKGDERFVLAKLTRSENSGQAIYLPSPDKKSNKRLLKQGKLVTVEVAALYLITAIYYNDLFISQSPYLTDFSLPKEKRRAANTKEVVNKAWEATESWYKRVKIDGMEKLRKDEEYPFRKSEVKFW